MRDNVTIGLVSPQSTDRVPTTGPQMYPGVKFIAKGVGVKALTTEGYDSAWDGIEPPRFRSSAGKARRRAPAKPIPAAPA